MSKLAQKIDVADNDDTDCGSKSVALRGGRTARGANQEEAAKMGAITVKWGCQGASGISRLLGVAKMHSAPGANNPRYAARNNAVSELQII